MITPDLFVLLFLLGACGTLYAYVGFPMLVTLLARRRAPDSAQVRTGDPATRGGAPGTTVTVIVPAYNEERNIAAKIRNVLDADYPRSLLDVIVVSDASTDRTNHIAASFASDGVRVIVQETRRGKSAGLNRAIVAAKGDIVVFTDANAAYPRGAICALLRYFGDPGVGLVTGYTRYTLEESGVGEVTNAYTALERALKRAESRWGCCVGADGAIFAMRRSLYRTLREDDINDFVLPLSVIDQGYRCVFAEDAFCAENPGQGLESEFRRQSRITNRTLRALSRHVHLLNPFRRPVFSFLLFSHKVVRFLVPFFLVLAGGSLAILAARRSVLLAAAAGLAALALAAVLRHRSHVSAAGSRAHRVAQLATAFLTINLAVLHGWWRFVSGRNDVTWQHDRSTV